MKRFTELRVWQRSHSLLLRIYAVTRDFPAEERYGLRSQIRRAALSIPTNIAEGAKRDSDVEYARFINIAESSLTETESLLFACRDLKFIAPGDAQELFRALSEIGRMLHGLRQTLLSRRPKAENADSRQPSAFGPKSRSSYQSAHATAACVT